jgi:hypothetical protein
MISRFSWLMSIPTKALSLDGDPTHSCSSRFWLLVFFALFRSFFASRLSIFSFSFVVVAIVIAPPPPPMLAFFLGRLAVGDEGDDDDELVELFDLDLLWSSLLIRCRGVLFPASSITLCAQPPPLQAFLACALSRSLKPDTSCSSTPSLSLSPAGDECGAVQVCPRIPRPLPYVHQLGVP